MHDYQCLIAFFRAWEHIYQSRFVFIADLEWNQFVIEHLDQLQHHLADAMRPEDVLFFYDAVTRIALDSSW